MFGLGSVAEERLSQEMLEAGGGLPQASQLSRCSPSITMTESSGLVQSLSIRDLQKKLWSMVGS